ncbi:MAG: hypothetical protein ACD_46C00125G0001 [uncultured bacterium]|nr:MAG: hypothetical protein ACD_46C00125G0001 [uncultured bacterium]
MIIGISGITGAGKSTLATALANKLQATGLFWDEFDEISTSPDDYVAWYNSNHDYAEFDYQALADVILALKNGKQVQHPVTKVLLEPTKFIIVDAPLGKKHQQTGQYIDVFIHVDVPLDIALARRVIRDLKNKNLREQDIIDELEYYLNKSRKLFSDEGMCEISNSADYIVDGLDDIEKQVNDIIAYINQEPTNLSDVTLEIQDKVDAKTEDKMCEQLIAFEAKNGIDVNYKQFSLILSKNNDVIGVLNAFTAFAEIYIDDIWVAEAFRQQGYGKLLLTELESRFKGKGFNNINLVTSAFQAPEFYKKCGFKLEFKRYNEKNPKLTKLFFVKFFAEDMQHQGIIQE